MQSNRHTDDHSCSFTYCIHGEIAGAITDAISSCIRHVKL